MAIKVNARETELKIGKNPKEMELFNGLKSKVKRQRKGEAFGATDIGQFDSTITSLDGASDVVCSCAKEQIARTSSIECRLNVGGKCLGVGIAVSLQTGDDFLIAQIFQVVDVLSHRCDIVFIVHRIEHRAEELFSMRFDNIHLFLSGGLMMTFSSRLQRYIKLTTPPNL